MSYETEVYQPQLRASFEFQDFVAVECWKRNIPIHVFQSKKYQLRGEGATGIEIKFDGKMEKTGNVYIEFEEKANPANVNYVPSGVMRDDGTWLWIVGCYKILLFFSGRQLRKVVEEVRAGRRAYRIVENGFKTSRAVLLDWDACQELAVHVVKPELDGKGAAP